MTAPVLHEAVVATATPVLRRDGWRPDNSPGPWFEVLLPSTADLSRLAGGPILLDHQMRSDLQVGVVEAAAVRDNAVIAQLRFGSDPRARQIEKDVTERTRRQVSVGYQVAGWSRSSDKAADIPTFTATDWAIYEVSVVPVGADPQARFRSESTPELRYRFMTTVDVQPAVTPVTVPAAITDAQRAEIITAERERGSSIMRYATHLELGTQG
jgi:HK97 family phage prohead protease